MGNLLSTAKQTLIDQANELFEIRRTDLHLALNEYQVHYENLGEIIFQIDSYKSFGGLITSMEKGDLERLGYYTNDDYLIEEFLKAIKTNQ